MNIAVHSSLKGGHVPRETFPGLSPEPAFPEDEFHRRIKQIRSRMRDAKIDVIVIKHPAHLFYVTGFQSLAMYEDGAAILPLDDDPTLILHPPELGTAMLHSWVGTLKGFPPEHSHAQYLAQELSMTGHAQARIGLEMLSPGVSAGFVRDLQSVLPQATFHDASGVIEEVKRIKSSAEIEHLRQAAHFTDQAMAAAINAAEVGSTDNDVAAAAAQAMVTAGSEAPCMSPIVTSGRRSGILHSTHKRIPLGAGDPVFIELGGCYQRYTSPLIRTLSLGDPSSEFRDAADACLAALNAVITTVKPGISAASVAERGWEEISRAGSDFVFHGNFGYTVGAGFPPSWADGTGLLELEQDMILESGMVFHHPVAIRRLGRFAVGFSETTVVTPDGCEVLTTTPRELALR